MNAAHIFYQQLKAKFDLKNIVLWMKTINFCIRMKTHRVATMRMVSLSSTSKVFCMDHIAIPIEAA